MPWKTRRAISSQAPADPVLGISAQAIEPAREDGEAQVEQPGAAVLVAEPAEGHHQHGGDQHVAHQHPQQQRDVTGGKGIEPETAEDGRQGDQQDRRVQRRGENADGGDAQRHPTLVDGRSRHGLAPFTAPVNAPANRC